LLNLVTLRFDIDQDLRLLVRTHQDVEHLLACPQSLRLPYRRRRNIDLDAGVGKVGTDLSERTPIEEHVTTRKEVRGGDEVLDGGDDGFAIAGRNEVVFDVH
jgi:hypothetical protein